MLMNIITTSARNHRSVQESAACRTDQRSSSIETASKAPPSLTRRSARGVRPFSVRPTITKALPRLYKRNAASATSLLGEPICRQPVANPNCTSPSMRTRYATNHMSSRLGRRAEKAAMHPPAITAAKPTVAKTSGTMFFLWSWVQYTVRLA